MKAIEIGRLLRADTSGFVAGCRVSQLDAPAFGGLVRVEVDGSLDIYGLISDIRIDDDGIVRQLVTADRVDDAVIADNRVNRNIPIEISVLTLGYKQGDRIHHMIPPRPPLSLDVIYQCPEDELREFTSSGNFGYFRHVLRAEDVPVGELLAAHIKQAQDAHTANGDPNWAERATQELIVLLRDDYATLMAVLGALRDALPEIWAKREEGF